MNGTLLKVYMLPFWFLCLQVKHDYEDSGLLYSMDQLQFETGQLGEGAFGVVRKAVLQISDAETVTVAVKALKGEPLISPKGICIFHKCALIF